MPDRTTEQRNSRSENVDQFSASEIVALMNQEDAQIAAAVHREQVAIARAIDAIVSSFQRGGRLFYIGAGTSGRLGVLDASECPPTFNSPPDMVIGIIAGGPAALTRSIEGAEDDPDQAALDLAQYDFNSTDLLVGIATSGRTPYVIGAVNHARNLGAVTVGLTCNRNSELLGRVDIAIAPVVGPEVVSGSTRLKAGTATKMVLNMLTTGAMILMGKTYGNLMVDLRTSNVKLTQRSVRIVSDITGLSLNQSEQRLADCDGEVKTAILAQMCDVDAQLARRLLQSTDGRLKDALDRHASNSDPTND